MAAPPIRISLKSDKDRQYASQLYDSYKGLFYKVAVQFFEQDTAEVEDAVSDALEAMCAYLPAIRKVPPSRLPAYMISIARHVCLLRLKDRNREKRHLIRLEASELENTLSSGDSLEDTAFSRANALALLDSFRQLTPRDRELIRMRHIDMMEYSDIALAMNMKEGAVRTALTRAKQRMVSQAKSEVMNDDAELV